MRSMKPRVVLSVIAGLAVLIVSAYIIVNQGSVSPDPSLKTAGFSGPPQATPIHHYGAEYGAITATLTSPDDVTFQIVAVQRGTTEWLFHIHAHNNGKQNVSILNASADHYFVLAGKGIPGTPYTFSQLAIKLAAPEQAVLAKYPVLLPQVAGGADSDGWLAADLTDFKYPPSQLLYVYGTVTAPACANPHDRNTCHPSTGYRTIVWTL